MIQLLEQIKTRKLTVAEASKRLGYTERQMYRLKARYTTEGPLGLIHKGKGVESKRKTDQSLWAVVDPLIFGILRGFGPTLVSEKLLELYQIRLSRETIRKRQQVLGAQVKTRKRSPYRSKRPRKNYFGQLVQLDGSPHDWFEGRAPKCTLIVAVDDATKMLMTLFFAPQESTFAVMQALKLYFDKHGVPEEFYTDRHSVYYVSDSLAREVGARTDLEKALFKLGSSIVHANSPQAKGRVERANGTLQDRLIAELRLRNICSIEEANNYLPTFIESYNRRFAEPALFPENRHRPIDPYNLDEILVSEETRQVHRDWTLLYQSKIYQIHKDQTIRIAPKDKILVRSYPDGTLKFFKKEHVLGVTQIIERPVFEAAHMPQKPRPPFLPSDMPPIGYRKHHKLTNSLC